MLKLFSAGISYFTDRQYRFDINTYLGFHNRMADKEFISKKFRLTMGYELNLNNPQTYSEKIQWLKLYDRRPVYTVMVDKVLAKEYAAQLIGAQHIIPTLGVWDDPNDINFSALPDRFVLKCNHNSGTGMYICKSKLHLDEGKVRAGLKHGLKENYYLSNREWPYKNVHRKILAEEYMEDKKTGDLRDYKFFCFDGEVKALFIATDRQTEGEETKFDFYDAEFNHLPFTNGHPNASIRPEKPDTFEEMKDIARILSKGFPHIRIDLYDINGKVYFGEFTFSHWSGMVPFVPEKWDRVFGDWLHLPEKCV